MDGKPPSTSVILNVAVDIISIFIVLLPFILLYAAEAISPYERGFFCDDESLTYPYKGSTVPFELLIPLGIFINIIVIIVVECFHRRQGNYKTSAAFIASCYHLVVAFVFGESLEHSTYHIIKYSVGKLTPHFFASCKPDWSQINCTDGRGYQVYVTDYTCLGRDEQQLLDMRQSFPSGHGCMAFYYATFLCIYLQLRFPREVGVLLKHCVCCVVMFGAIVIALSRLWDNKHHGIDVLAGCTLGAGIATFTVCVVSPLLKMTVPRKKELMVSQLNSTS